MFQFTTTHIVNKLPESHFDGNTLILERMGRFIKDNVKHIYKAEGYAEVPEVLTIKFKEVDKKKTVRINLWIALSEGSNNPMYANDYWRKGKSFITEVTVKADDSLAEAFANQIKKYDLAVHEEKLFDVKAEGNTLTITAVNGYQRFVKYDVEELDREANHGMGEYEELDGATAEITTNGRESFADSEWIEHNLRIPTTMHTVYKAIGSDERPIEGAVYDQYTIHMCADRDVLGTNAVGQTVTSTTTHVYFVRHELASDFETILDDIKPTSGIEASGKKEETTEGTTENTTEDNE